MATCSSFAIAQVSPNEQRPPADERTAPGKLISAGKNSAPVGSLKAKTYRLEEVQLKEPLKYQTACGEDAVLQSAFRLTITLDSLPVNNYIICLDGVPLQAYVSGDARVGSENAVSVLMYAPKALVQDSPKIPARDGATLALSTLSQRNQRSTLPEKLSLPDNLASKAKSNAPCATAACTQIDSIRSVLRVSGEERTPMVAIAVSCPKGLPLLDSGTTLIINDEIFDGGVSGTQAVFEMTSKKFASLVDGSNVLLRHGPLTVVLGRLNKGMLDK